MQEFSPQTVRPIAHGRFRRNGFTLLEVLIATAVTLLMMASLAQIFKTIGDSMKQGRAALELNNRLRGVAFRIDHDLRNFTALANPPGGSPNGLGYFKIQDGSFTDYTAAQLSPALSRFGDVDDILMATVRAGDVWFSGKVPRFVLTNGVSDPIDPADFELVTIAAQHAEVVIFAQPVPGNSGNLDRNPAFLVADPHAFQDDDANGLPDDYRLYYRTLLIRPDLNHPGTGLLPYVPGMGGASPWLVASQQSRSLPGVGNFTLPPMCDMALTHGQCDLSLRRVFNPSDGLPGTMDRVAANSLEDLVHPQNRFAHVQLAIDKTNSTTMPLLALAQAYPIHQSGIWQDPNGTGSSGFVLGSGLLHPAFMLHGERAGEDVLASDLRAFDIKVFDPGAPLIATVGPDGGAGVAGVDDNRNGTTDDLAEIGWAGSDDFILTPNDPGFAPSLAGIAGGLSTKVGSGDYVDLAWGRKIAAHVSRLPPPNNTFAAGQLYGPGEPLRPLSGLSTLALDDYSLGLFKSGNVVVDRATLAILILQPSYDTWTTQFEGDNALQAYRDTWKGNLQLDGRRRLYGASNHDHALAFYDFRRTAVDAGHDGVDNNSNLVAGVDDISELETSAPFPIALRGFQISIRMEDLATRQVKQMSVSKEFVTQ